MKESLNSLYGLRVLGTAGIFLFHSGFLPEGTFPVTLFFMLSGFLLYYTKSEYIDGCNFIQYTKKVWVKKLKQFYPLHFITFIAALFIGTNPLSLDTAIKALLNLSLTQAFFQKYAMSFNGLSWYLSVTMFLYFVGYFLLKIAKNIKKPQVGVVLCWIMLIIFNVINRLGGELYLYSNPIYRAIDFFLGILVAKCFYEKVYFNDRNDNKKLNNIIELSIVVVFIIQYIVSLKISSSPGYYSVIFSIALYVFANGKGFVSNLLSCDLFHKLSSYTFEFYMIHELVLRCFRKLIPEDSMGYLARITAIAVPSFVITVILVLVYKKAFEVLEKRQKIKNNVV